MPDLEQTGGGQLPFLYATSRVISSGRPIDAVLQELVAMAVDATRCDAYLLSLVDHENGEIVVRASRARQEGESGALRMKAGEGLASWLAQHSSPQALSSGASADARFRLDCSLLEEAFEAVISTPLVGGGQVTGALHVHYRERREHSRETLALLIFLGEQMGGVVAYARLSQQNATLKQQALLARQQLEERKTVERAKGLLQQRFGLSEEQAYQRLRDESRRRRMPMREVAEAVLLVEGIAMPRQNGTEVR